VDFGVHDLTMLTLEMLVEPDGLAVLGDGLIQPVGV
jgi:hypothetical protein